MTDSAPAAAPAIAIGDTVQLVTGGPNMVVEHHRTDGFTGCVWFFDGEAYREAFPTNALRKPSGTLSVVIGKGGGGGGGA
jgi:uncharacterized protein YodC (DUF2158 family)